MLVHLQVRTMLIEVYSDTVCPWCYVGYGRLRAALQQRPALATEVRWLPFELNPDLPVPGMDRAQYMQQRFGDVNRFAKAQGMLREIGAELGLGFDFDAIRRMPNTRRSHALIAWSASKGCQGDIKRRVLEAYFAGGRDIGEPEVLAALAAEAGLDAAEARAAIDDAALHAAIEQLEQQARSWQVSGVPTFIFDRRYAFSGAQPLEVFLQALDAAARDAASPAPAVAAGTDGSCR
jgi:predicted DsbA family dithiol-disulfide isomerase